MFASKQLRLARGICQCLLKSQTTVTPNHTRWVHLGRITFKSADGVEHDLRARHVPSNLEKKMLVYAKTYENVEAVPNEVSPAQMKRAKDLYRVRVSLWMIAATVVGCVVMVISGRYSQSQGESVAKTEMARMSALRAQGRQEEEDARKRQ